MDDTLRVIPVAMLLDTIGWTPGAASEKSGVSTRTWRRWKADSDQMPDHVYRWLRSIAAAHEAFPYPAGWPE